MREVTDRPYHPISLFVFMFSIILLFCASHATGQLRADFSVDVDSGSVPLYVQFHDASSPTDSIIRWEWDLNGDGHIDSRDRNPRWMYELPADYDVMLIVTDSTGSDTLRRTAYIRVSPVPDEQLLLNIRVVDPSGRLARYVELWGYDGDGLPLPSAPISIRMPIDDHGYARFYRDKFMLLTSQSISDLLLLDEDGTVLGKCGFHYPIKDLIARRRKDAIVTLHRYLTTYQNHPRERTAESGWMFPLAVRYPWRIGEDVTRFLGAADPVNAPLHQLSMLIPPARFDDGAQGWAEYRLDNVRPERMPLLLLHDVGRRDAAWGADHDIVTESDTSSASLNDKRDYMWTSYAGRLQRLDEADSGRFDVWQYVYPPDQSWEESAYLFVRDIDLVTSMYDTARAVAVGHGMGGLVLRSYLQGTASNFVFYGDPTDPVAKGDKIARAVLLGTPNAGRSRAATDYGSEPMRPGVMDPAAPALRELTPGSRSLLRLAESTLPTDVAVLGIAGNSPDTHGTALRESQLHDDGLTAVSSAMLDRPNVWNALLSGYSSDMLHASDLFVHGTAIPEADLLPTIIRAWLLSDTGLVPYESRFTYLHAPDSIRFGQDVYTKPGALPLHVDVGIPLLRLYEDATTPFIPVSPWRLRLSTENVARLHIDTPQHPENLDLPGLHLVSSGLSFSSSRILREHISDRHTLFPYARSGAVNPLHQKSIELSGFGWQLPAIDGHRIFDPLLTVQDDLGRSFDITATTGSIALQWSRTTMNDLTIGRHAALLLQNTDALRAVTHGELGIDVDCLTNAFSFLLRYSGRDAPRLELHSPDNTVITPFDANDSTIFYTRDDAMGVMYMTILQALEGRWSLFFDDVSALPDQCTFAWSTDASLMLNLSLDSRRVLTGDTVITSIYLGGNTSLVTNTVAECVFTDSSGVAHVLTMRDDGIAPDSLAGDGIFTATFIPYVSGPARIDARMSAEAGGCDIHRTRTVLFDIGPGLELLSPSGGEEWQSGTTQRIRWRGEAPQHVTLHYSIDGGVSWVSIVESHPADAGEYPWTVPELTSTRCRVLISDADSPSRADTSSADFLIYEQRELVLKSPGGGEHWQVGTQQRIVWTSIAVDRIDLMYSTNAGTEWLPVATDIDARAGIFDWQIPATPSDECLIRIVDVDDDSVSDTGSELFIITPMPAITVITPNGGESWREGDVEIIRWLSAVIDSVRIEFTTDGGLSWSLIDMRSAAQNEYAWTIPPTPSLNCYVRIISIDKPSIADTSDEAFSITLQPRLRLLAPVGGEEWEISTQQYIQWESVAIERIVLEYTTDNGGFWRTIVINYPADSARYAWTIPIEPSTMCRIRIRDTYDTLRWSISPSPFSITESLTRPTLYAPLDKSSGISTRPLFRWLPFRGAQRYQLQVSEHANLSVMIIDRPDLEADYFQAEELASNTTYWWRLRAFGDGWNSDWSALWKFTTSESIYGTPMLVSPPDGSLGLYISIPFYWYTSDSAVTWHFQLAEDMRFTSLIDETYGLTGTTHTVGGLFENSDYYWRVRGGDQSSTAFGNWSEAWKLSTAPSPPRHIAPFNGLADAPLTPLLQWFPIPAARHFRVQVALDYSFGNIILDTTLIESSLRLSGLASYRMYYWRMNVSNIRGTSRWSLPWYFRTLDVGVDVQAMTHSPNTLRIHSLYPQPVSDQLHLVVQTGGAAYTLEVYDVLGRNILSSSREASTSGISSISLETASWPAGVYMLRIRTCTYAVAAVFRVTRLSGTK